MDLVFLDTETTSLNPETGEVWEFAGIRRAFPGSWWFDQAPGGMLDGEPFAVEHTLNFQISVDLGQADPFALKIGKYRERFNTNGSWWGPEVTDETDGYGKLINHIVDNPFPQPGAVIQSKFDAAALIEKFTRDALIVGNVISFDANRLERLLMAYGETPGWHYHIQDIEPMIAGYLRGLGVHVDLGEQLTKATEPPYDSDLLTKALGVKPPSEEERHTALGDARWVMRQWDALHVE